MHKLDPSTRHAALRASSEDQEWISLPSVVNLLSEITDDAADLEGNRTFKLLLEQLVSTGCHARWALPDVHRVQALRSSFPNFSEVIDLYVGHAVLAASAGAKPRPIDPVLLLGDPGVGKTTFALALAAALRAPFRCHAMSVATSGFTLSGLDRGWTNGRPGLVFDVFRREGTINPVILLDEIDKSSTESRFSPIGPLYQLLEPATSCQFVDEFVGLPINASFITWIATANEESTIPAAIQSRFQSFWIEAPTPGQMLDVVRRQFEAICADHPAVHPRIPEEVLNELIKFTPRDAHQLLCNVVSRAAVRAHHARRSIVTITRLDLPSAEKLPKPRKVGFV